MSPTSGVPPATLILTFVALLAVISLIRFVQGADIRQTDPIAERYMFVVAQLALVATFVYASA